jgi:hypothetical protein
VKCIPSLARNVVKQRSDKVVLDGAALWLEFFATTFIFLLLSEIDVKNYLILGLILRQYIKGKGFS